MRSVFSRTFKKETAATRRASETAKPPTLIYESEPNMFIHNL